MKYLAIVCFSSEEEFDVWREWESKNRPPSENMRGGATATPTPQSAAIWAKHIVYSFFDERPPILEDKK